MKHFSRMLIIMGMALILIAGLAGCASLFKDPEKEQLKADLSFAQTQQSMLAKAWSDQSFNSTLALLQQRQSELEARLAANEQASRDWYTYLVASERLPQAAAADAMAPGGGRGLAAWPAWALIGLGAVGMLIVLFGLLMLRYREA